MTSSLLPEFPTLNIERALWANGALWVAGIDEAGRGALAGPVTAAALILPQINQMTEVLHGVRDSKKMSANQRDTWAITIKAAAVTYAVGTASSKEIDTLGILPATKLAANRAIQKLSIIPDHILIDHFQLPDLLLPQTSFPKGDVISLSIAAASVLAKTSRDRFLDELDSIYPGYGFSSHKGYGTTTHLAAIEALGPTPIHRMSFSPLKNFKWEKSEKS